MAGSRNQGVHTFFVGISSKANEVKQFEFKLADYDLVVQHDSHYATGTHRGELYAFVYIRRAYDKFPDFFRMGTFIDSTHMKL